MISKLLLARLRPILQRIVGPFQNSFLAGRSPYDNMILTQEVVHSLMSLKGRKGGMILKLDIHKAYDTVSWQFLRERVLLLDFTHELLDLIMFSISHMTTYIIWNGVFDFLSFHLLGAFVMGILSRHISLSWSWRDFTI